MPFNRWSQHAPVTVWQPWISTSQVWLTAGPHTGDTSVLKISFLSKSSGLQSRQDTKLKPSVLVYWFGSFLLFCKWKSKTQLKMHMREECTYIGKRRKRESKTKAAKTVAWFCLVSTTAPSLSQRCLGYEWSVKAAVHLCRFVQMAWYFSKIRQSLRNMDSF